MKHPIFTKIYLLIVALLISVNLASRASMTIAVDDVSDLSGVYIIPSGQNVLNGEKVSRLLLNSDSCFVMTTDNSVCYTGVWTVNDSCLRLVCHKPEFKQLLQYKHYIELKQFQFVDTIINFSVRTDTLTVDEMYLPDLFVKTDDIYIIDKMKRMDFMWDGPSQLVADMKNCITGNDTVSFSRILQTDVRVNSMTPFAKTMVYRFAIHERRPEFMTIMFNAGWPIIQPRQEQSIQSLIEYNELNPLKYAFRLIDFPMKNDIAPADVRDLDSRNQAVLDFLLLHMENGHDNESVRAAYSDAKEEAEMSEEDMRAMGRMQAINYYML